MGRVLFTKEGDYSTASQTSAIGRGGQPTSTRRASTTRRYTGQGGHTPSCNSVQREQNNVVLRLPHLCAIIAVEKLWG